MQISSVKEGRFWELRTFWPVRAALKGPLRVKTWSRLELDVAEWG